MLPETGNALPFGSRKSAQFSDLNWPFAYQARPRSSREARRVALPKSVKRLDNVGRGRRRSTVCDMMVNRRIVGTDFELPLGFHDLSVGTVA
jgi:hypothetical protein